MNLLLQGVEKLIRMLNLPGIPLKKPIGSSPEFCAQREEWLETCNRDETLTDFTKYLLYGNASTKAVFTLGEVTTLESTFKRYANLENCWDQRSLESYLLAHIPHNEKVQALLKASSYSLWILVDYFSQWPFNAPTSTGLTFSPFVRAIAFLCGRHSVMFEPWDHEDEYSSRRTEKLALEHIFRALATTSPCLSSPKELTVSSSQRDILDLLNTTQPLLNEFTTRMDRNELLPTATRISSACPPALSTLTVSTASTLIPLIDLSVLLLQHASAFDITTTPTILMNDLKTTRVELQDQNMEETPFNTFMKLLGDDDLNIYDGIALLFNTFPNIGSLTDGIMHDAFSSEKMNLLLYALRRPGLTLVSP